MFLFSRLLKIIPRFVLSIFIATVLFGCAQKVAYHSVDNQLVDSFPKYQTKTQKLEGSKPEDSKYEPSKYEMRERIPTPPWLLNKNKGNQNGS
jgi:hypothetical protein